MATCETERVLRYHADPCVNPNVRCVRTFFGKLGSSSTNALLVSQPSRAKNETDKYHFDIWDYSYQRISINFFAIMGKDVIDAFPFPIEDDESYLTERRSKELGRHVIVEGIWARCALFVRSSVQGAQ